MRGALHDLAQLFADNGITPAYAGSNVCQVVCGRQLEDHPRVCGEHSLLMRLASSEAGSPPRMRGARHSTIVPQFLTRITPAYAGSTN